jgi:hypothetical protein
VEWLAAAARRGWIVLTHNQRIRYTPNELAAVIRHGVSLLVIVGRAPYPELAPSFVKSLPRVERFLNRYQPPFIGKVYRPTPEESAKNPSAPGKVDLWYPE